MCNLYKIVAGFQAIAALLGEMLKYPLLFPQGVTAETTNMQIPSLIYPRRQGLVLRPADPAEPQIGLEPVIMHWNLTPFFHKGSLKEWKASTNNCRSETMDTSPAFRDAYRRRRCIIPASNIVEWSGPKGTKTEHAISRADGKLMWLAGLWDRCRIEGEEVESYTMVMQEALPGHDMHRFHNRQPSILDAETARIWLDLSADGRHAIRPPAPGTLVADPPEPLAA